MDRRVTRAIATSSGWVDQLAAVASRAWLESIVGLYGGYGHKRVECIVDPGHSLDIAIYPFQAYLLLRWKAL